MLPRVIEVQSVLNRSRISGIDYTVNPYIGCEHGCTYCYADFIQRFTGHKESWGSFLDVKINAPSLLTRKLRQASTGVVCFSTVTDPYQPQEEHFQITRSCLEELLNSNLSLSILTKSPLVLRDLDLVKKFPRAEIGISLCSLDPEIIAIIESKTPPPDLRLNALRLAKNEDIKTWLFVAPLLPGISDSEESLAALLEEGKKAKVDYVLVDSLQLYPKVWVKIKPVLTKKLPHLLPAWEEYRKNPTFFREGWRRKLEGLAAKIKLEVRCCF